MFAWDESDEQSSDCPTGEESGVSSSEESETENRSIARRNETKEMEAREAGNWVCTLDPITTQCYYYNTVTRRTSWLKPQVTCWCMPHHVS